MELEDFNQIRKHMRKCIDYLPDVGVPNKSDWNYYMSNNSHMVKHQKRITQTIKDYLNIDLESVKWEEPIDKLGLARISKFQRKVI